MKILAFWLLLFNILLSLELQKPMLYKENLSNIDGWFMSEKLDGVRAYWNGKELLSKNGNKIFAPSWFTKDFPPFPLDGELWTKRDDFENIQSIVLSQNSSKRWETISYNIFEVPNIKGDFRARLHFLETYLTKNPNKYIKIVPQKVCKNKDELNLYLQELISIKAEGVILKNPNTLYEVGRSKNYLKVKNFLDDEGLVVGHNYNIDNSFKSLKIKLQNGTIFNLGNGFKNKERENPPKIGSIVTFKYYGLTKNGKPKFASFLRVRETE